MAPELVGLTGFVVLLVLIALRAPIAIALILVGFFGVWSLHGLDSAIYVASDAPIAALSNYTLSTLPMFLFMGVLVVRCRIADDLFRAANSFVGHHRGGLSMAGIVACAGFGAVCGSSLATVSTMGKIAVPQMLRYGYQPRLAAGSVAAGATLGILIPPSLPMIIYAILTETSIGKLFAAGVIPGIIATALYMAAITVWMWWRPEYGPPAAHASWADRLRTLRSVWSIIAMFALVMGGIFLGLFSPTEGAAMGAGAAALIGAVTRRLSWTSFVEGVLESVQITTVILFIIIGINIYEFFLQASRIPEAIVALVGAMHLGPYQLIALLIVAFVFLGCVLDSVAILFIFTPVVFPLVLHAGFDPIWFGVTMIMVVEFGLMTPPIGMNVFILTKVVPELKLSDTFAGVGPFIVADIIRIILFVLFPGLVLFLPNLLFPG